MRAKKQICCSKLNLEPDTQRSRRAAAIVNWARTELASRREGIAAMIDLLYWTPPNGRKGSHLLEEVWGVDYTAHAIVITPARTVRPDFPGISPHKTRSRDQGP